MSTVPISADQACPATIDPMPDLGPEAIAPATESPSLPELDAVWACVYGAGGAIGDRLQWQREGEVSEVSGEEHERVRQLLNGLSPSDPNGACTMELGPIFRLVLVAGGEATVVHFSNFGCREVRMTTLDPETAVLPGTVTGSLQADPALRTAIAEWIPA